MSPLRVRLLVLGSAVAALFGLAVRNGWLRDVPGFHCEGFGCLGLGVMVFALGCAVPFVFALGALVAGRKNRLARAGEAFVVATMCMTVCAVVLWALGRRDVADGCQQALDTCVAQPRLCTETDLAAYRGCAKL